MELNRNLVRREIHLLKIPVKIKIKIITIISVSQAKIIDKMVTGLTLGMTIYCNSMNNWRANVLSLKLFKTLIVKFKKNDFKRRR